MSREWRNLAGIQKRSEFDGIVTRMQMQGYVTTADFEYAEDRFENPYGWGLARYALPEKHFKEGFSKMVYLRKPEESRMRMQNWLRDRFSYWTEKQRNGLTG